MLSRACGNRTSASHWEEIWEAGPYYDRISELLDQSRKYAIFVGWQLDSRLPMRRTNGETETLRNKLLRLCEEKPDFEVFLLMWDHAYFYMLEREFGQSRIWEGIHPRIHLVFDNRHPFGGSHHEKICVIDGIEAFCGGIDVCDRRWDSPEHLYEDPRRSLDGLREKHGPYHDFAVEVKGQVVQLIHRHVAQRWRALSPIRFPEPMPAEAGPHELILSRTQASIDGVYPRPLREIEALFRELIGSAEKQVLLEGQYFWSWELLDLLISRMRERRSPDFKVTLILSDLAKVDSPTRFMASHERELISRLTRAARYSGCTFRAGAPYVRANARGPGLLPKPVYVHSKVLLIDDRYLSVGSANFAARALNLDTEVQLTWIARAEAERAHFRRLGRELEYHWNLSDAPGRPLNLVPLFKEGSEPPPPLIARLPVLSAFFDPKSPWMEPMKKALGAWSWPFSFRRLPKACRYPLPIAALAFAQALGLVILDPRTSKDPGLSLLFAVMGSVWILPVPFLWVLLVFAIAAPADAISAGIAAIWTNSVLGYSYGRIFPAKASRSLGISARNSQESPRIDRSLRGTIRFLFDPRLSFRKKIALLGIRFIPVPWFALGAGIALPLALVAVFWLGKALITRLGS